MAADRGGVALQAKLDAHQPFYQSTAQAQAEYILDNVEKICAAE